MRGSEGATELFEKASEIRAVQREKMLRKAHAKGRKEGREEALAEIRSRLQSAAIKKDPATGAITLSPEDLEYLLGERGEAAGR